jgi:hypothetical protein
VDEDEVVQTTDSFKNHSLRAIDVTNYGKAASFSLDLAESSIH